MHVTGIPFNDASGDRLREWLGVSQEQFYDPTKFCDGGDGLLLSGPGCTRRRPAAAPRMRACVA